MLAPLSAPNRVPPPTEDRESRPGMRPIHWSTTSTVRAARPVFNSSSPIRRNSGIGTSANCPTDEKVLVASSDNAPSPPRKK